MSGWPAYPTALFVIRAHPRKSAGKGFPAFGDLWQFWHFWQLSYPSNTCCSMAIFTFRFFQRSIVLRACFSLVRSTPRDSPSRAAADENPCYHNLQRRRGIGSAALKDYPFISKAVRSGLLRIRARALAGPSSCPLPLSFRATARERTRPGVLSKPGFGLLGWD